MRSNHTGLSKESLERLVELLHGEDKVSATLVVISKETGKDHTYKIKASTKGSNRNIFIGFEVGYNKFINCAHTWAGRVQIDRVHQGRKSTVVLGAVWLLEKLLANNIDRILDNAIIKHTGKCIKCNRELTDATSIEFGMGPICRGASTVAYNRENP